jgi:hypothetical protein
MSTKTTLKRIALVAVSALGLGLMSVAPAKAAWPTTVTLGTPTANVAVVGATSTITAPVTITTAGNSDTFTVSAIPSAWPTGSTVDAAADVTAVHGASVAAGTANYTTVGSWGSSINASNESTFTMTAGPTGAYAGSASTFFTFTPDVAGSYTFAVFLDGVTAGDPTGALKSGDTVKYITITAVGPNATGVTLTQQLAGTGVTYADGTAAGSQGIWVRVNATDAAGALTRISSSQLVMITVPSGLTLQRKNNGSSTTASLTVSGADYALAGSDFNAAGYAWIQLYGESDGSHELKAKISNQTTESALALVYDSIEAAATVCAAYADGNPDGSDIPASTYVNSASGIQTVAQTMVVASTATSTDFTVCAAAADLEENLAVRVTDTNFKIFGNATALSQDLSVTTADAAGEDDATDGKAYASFTVDHAALGRIANDSVYSAFSVLVSTTTSGAPAGTTTVTGSVAAADSDNITIKPATSVKVVNGGTITYTATFANNFGALRAGIAVTAQIVAGRNLQAVATPLITNASGEASFTVTDAAPTSTTLTSTVRFSDGSATADATITWVSALTASTMVTVPSATTSSALQPGSTNNIYTSTATASTGAVAVTATVKDAQGIALAGLPVTITVPSDVSLKSTTPAVAYTNSSGVATWSVYSTKAGTYALTFAGGGLTKTGYIKFVGATARVVSVTAGTTTGETTPITIKAADAYGNGVANTALTVSTTGGYFQGAALSSNINTDANGEIRLLLVGNGTVTATGTSTHMFYGAALVGTTAAAGFPAGVSTASVTVSTAGASASAVAAEAAADAAAEAIDAANAATDAANLAAEAADAATVAAEEARDAADAATAAVEELATQVATLMAALKAQITTLANTVAKIAKKVRA